jgi:hypothetical protein
MNESPLLELLEDLRVMFVLQPYAVEARYEEGPFPLAASREVILEAMEHLRDEAVALLGEG